MTCHDIVPQLPAYEDGDLSPAEMADIERHLETCRACATEKAALAQAWAMLDQVPTATVASDFSERFWERARASRGAEQPVAAMTCHEVVENLPAFADGDLLPAQLVAVEQHLDQCAGCLSERSALEEAWALVGQYPPSVAVASDFNHRFWKRVEAQPVSIWGRLSQLFRAPARAVAVFAVMLVLLASIFVPRPVPPPLDPGPGMVAPAVDDDDAHYSVLGDPGDLVPDLDETDPAPPTQTKASASSDDQIDKVLQDLPLDSNGPQG